MLTSATKNFKKAKYLRKIILIVFAFSLFYCPTMQGKNLPPVPETVGEKKEIKKSEPAKTTSAVPAVKKPPVENGKTSADSKTKNTLPVKSSDSKVTKAEQKPKAESKTAETSTGSNIDLNLQKTEQKTIVIGKPPEKIDNPLFDLNEDKTKESFEIQKKMDIEDIKALWESTVDQNAVIRFALKKLAMPPEQRRIHSSIMARSLSTLISGVAILPNILGADSFMSTASVAGGSLANRVLNNKTMPKEMPITDTELIQLAGLIEDLQNRIIKNYYDYKSSLEALKKCRQNIIIQNRLYANAIKTNNEIAVISSSALYDKELLNELRLKQEIKLRRIELERMAGEKTVSQLNLTKTNDLKKG